MANAYVSDSAGSAKFSKWGSLPNSISTALASAATVTPLSYISVVTGTVSISSIVLPWPGFEGEIVLIYTDATPGVTATGGTTGIAIALATTVVRYKALVMVYTINTGLWYPSY